MAAPLTEAPPTWDELQADPRFTALSGGDKLDILDRWNADVQQHLGDGYDQERADPFLNEQRAKIASEGQSPISTAARSVVTGMNEVVTGAVQGVGGLMQDATDAINQFSGVPGMGQAIIDPIPGARLARAAAPFAQSVAEESQRFYAPDARLNPMSATIGSGLGQAVGMVPSLIAGPAGPLVLGGAAGYSQGRDTAMDLGVKNPLGKMALGAGFGATELLTERLGGIGSGPLKQGAADMLNRVAGRSLQTIASEAIEEPITGIAQDAMALGAGTLAGAPEAKLAPLSPMSPEYWNRRGMEALGGAAGGAFFAGVGKLAGRPGAELPPMQTGNAQIDQVNAVLRASGPSAELPMGNEGASDEDFDAFEQTRAPAATSSTFASVNDRNVPADATGLIVGEAQDVAGSTPAAGTNQTGLGNTGLRPEAQGLGNQTPSAASLQPQAAVPVPVPSIDNIGRQFAPPQVRSVPVIPDNPLGYRDSLDFLNEMPIAISRSGTGGELDWQETANIPKYYRPFIANEQGLPIDVVAEAAYEANLIPQPTADALMKRVQEDTGARRTYRVQGREQKAELLTREKQTVSFDKSQTKLGNKATAVQVPFDALATGDQLTIDGEQVTVRAVESDEGGYLTKVVLEDGKKFGVQEFNPQSREGVFVDAFDPKPRLAGDPEVFSPAQAGGASLGGLTEADVQWFGDSKVTRAGKPHVLYHKTAADFDEFSSTEANKGTKPVEVGFHFGTLRAANEVPRKAGRTIPVILYVKKPLRISDPGFFLPGPDFQEALDERGKGYINGYADDLIKELESYGYDGIVYKNHSEGGGSDSWMVFRPDQIRILNKKAQSTPLTGQAGESRLDMLGRGPSKTEQGDLPPSPAAVNPNLNPAALESPARGLGRGLGAILGQPPPGAATSQRPTTTAPANAPAMSQALFDQARAVTSQQASPPVELEELFTRARNLLANDGSMELRPSDRTVIPQALAKLAAGENPQLIVNQWKQHRNDAVQGRTTAATPFAEYAQAPTDPGTPRARLLSAYAQLDRTGQGYVRIPDLVRASGLPIADVREVLIDLSDRNQAYLTPADEPRNIPASDRSLLVVGPSGPSLYVTLPDPAALASPAQLTAQDAAYLAAVEAGDMETAQRMVDEAAKAAGYEKRWNFSERIGIDPNRGAFYTTSSKAAADSWGENRNGETRAVFISSKAPAIEGKNILSSSFMSPELVEKLKSAGFDSASGGRDWKRGDEIAVFDPSQIKSAAPITRDQQGNVIPLSQRFNSDSDSILYSPPTVSNRTVYKRNTALNKAELARLGLPTDTGKSVQGQKPVKEALSRIAKDMRLPTTVRRMAKELQNADLSGLYFQVVADGRKEYTGLYQPLRGGQGELVVNLRHLGRGNVDPALNMAETLVHEVLHHATYRALRGPKNDVQRAAIGNLEQLRRRVKAVLGSQQMADFGYQTKNIDEFIAALFTQKPFQDALAAIPAEQTPKSLVQQVRTLLDEAFRLLAEIVTGKKVPPGSVLDAAFQNALRLVEDGVRVAGTEKVGAPLANAAQATPSPGGLTEAEAKQLQNTKVTDGDGKPLLLHHGGSGVVSEWSQASRGQLGIAYFTNSRRNALRYAIGGGVSELSTTELLRRARESTRKPTVTRVYLNFENPLDATDYRISPSFQDVFDTIGAKQILNLLRDESATTYADIRDKFEVSDSDQAFAEWAEENISEFEDSLSDFFVENDNDSLAKEPVLRFLAGLWDNQKSSSLLDQYMEAKGFDGLIYNDYEAGGTTYVARKPSQIFVVKEDSFDFNSAAPLANPSQAVPLKPEFGGAFPGHTPYQAKERQAWAAQEIATLSAEQLAQRVEAGQYGPVDKPFVLAAGMQRAERQVRTATTQAAQIVAQTEVNRLRDLLNPQNSLAGQTLVAQRDALGEMRDRVPGLAVNEAVEKAQVQTIDAAIPVQPTVTGLADLTTQASTEATETVGGMLEAEGLGFEEADSTPQEQAAGEAVQSDLEAEVLRLKQMQTAERNQFSRLTTKLQKILATLQAFAGNKGAVIAGVKARLAARRAARANTVAANKLQSLSSPAQGITAPTLPDTALDDGLEVLLTQGIQIDDWKAAMTKRLGPKYASQLTDLYEQAVDLYQTELTAAHAEVEKRVKEKKAKQKPTTRPQPQRKPLAQSFPDLAKMLRKLGPAISGLNWRQIMTSTATAQRQWELDTYAQIRQHPRLSALSPEQAKQLTRELSKAWQRERRKVWKRELDKTLIAAGMAKPKHRAKIEASAPRLLSLINLGALNAATFRDAVAKEFGLKSMTDADVLKVKALAEDLQNTPEGVPYRRKAQAFIEGLEDLTKIPAVQLLESYWTAAVLSGLRTQFDIFLGFANAIENTAGSVITALRTGQRQVIADTIFSTFARFPSAMAEGYQVLKTGKRGLTASYDQDIKGNLENGYITMGASARALIAKGALGKLPGYPMLMLARLMSASGHVTTSMAYEGAKAMALARNAALYQRSLKITAKDRENARQQARQVLTGGAMPANSEERAAEKAYARELLDQQFATTEVLAQANEIAMEAALEGEVQQYSLGNMIVGLARYVNNIPQRAIDALEKDGAPRKQDKVLLAALRFAAPLARVVTGTKFIRTAGHAANRSLSYLPGLGLVRVVEKGMDGAKMDILMAQQMIGLSIGLAIYMLLPGPDDEEPQWGIEGGWKNLTPQQKSQLFSQGKQPFSLWWTDGKGKLRTVNYMNWGVNNVLGMVGTMQDQRRYLGKTDPMGIALNGILTGLWQWQDRVSLQQLQILTGSDTAFGSKDVTTNFAERLNKFGATTVGGLFPRLAKDFEAMADPTLRSTDEWWQMWAREVPMVRQLTSGARIDILGNEIKIDRGPLSRITQAMIAPPEYRLVGALNARDVWLPDPSSSKPKVPMVGADPRDLTPLESDRYQRKAGQLAKDYILANGPQLLTLEPEKAQDAIRKNAENWRKQALNWAVRK